MKFIAKVSGKKIDWPAPHDTQWIFERKPGGWIIAIDVNDPKRRVRFFYERVKNQFWANVAGHHYFGEKNSVERNVDSDAGPSADAFKAQFPGRVRKVLVKDQQVVNKGDVLLMVEAMKMEFAIKATDQGIVKKVLVAEGETLTPGQLLLHFEAQK